MKKYSFFVFLAFISFHVIAQQDTASFAAQRVKVNLLLKQRSDRFGKYDESLNQRSGIFGWQTKKDIKNSNEILREVVLTDNNIFKELKVLMDYKDTQNQQKVALADQSEERIANYKRGIKKLQDENADLRNDVIKVEKGNNISNYIMMFLILVIAGGYYFFSKKIKRYEKTTI